MARLSFDKIDRSGTGKREAAYFVALFMLATGVAMSFMATGAAARVTGIGVLFAACMTYVYLLRTTPKLRYFTYLWLDQDGVHHIEGGHSANRTAHFAWHEIQDVEASLDEFQGLILTLGRAGMCGVPVFLSADHAAEAAAAIKDCIGSQTSRTALSLGESVSFSLLC